ncbi:glycine betaine ABC transporter substrate-binding protein [Gudongella sp. DL1XJH-153]|uniref:ABC transporter substrate-binding protein n=1 Tax=Gudongella sp. DL1XJH-153 TaxID=3409804 RepID=UPI003BB80D2A
MRRIVLFSMIMILAIGTLTGCGESEKVIEIGHKNYTEQRIVGQLFSKIIEAKTDYETNVTEFGSTSIVFGALKAEEVDVYGEYTGTAYAALLGESELNDPQEVYDYVKQNFEEELNLYWLNEMGFNNTYTFSVLPEVAEEYNLETISDLTEVSDELVLGAVMEFIEREDGLPGVQEFYGGFEFKDVIALDPGLRYNVVEEGKADVIDAFSTDGKILVYDLKVLEDDKQFFPPYFAAPVVTEDLYNNYPEVVEALNLLGGVLTDEEMQELNYKVGEEGMDPEVVAEEFLTEKGLI